MSLRQSFENAFRSAVDLFTSPSTVKKLSTELSEMKVVLDRYESAYQWWGTRGYVPGTIQDARYDMNPSTRLELLRKSRHWEQNSGILQRLIDVFELYLVGGAGLHLTPSSADEDWNHAALSWWNDWSRNPAVDNKQALSTLESLMARSWFVDGELFILKTYDKATGKPAIQLIESHRVATPSQYTSREGIDIIDGVEIDKIGKPAAYYVRSSDFSASSGSSYQVGIAGLSLGQTQSENFERVEASRIIHLFEQVRPGQYRGLPMAYAVLNDTQDLYELQHLEMKAARDAAKITNVVTNKIGEANTQNSRRQKWQVNSQDAAGNNTTKTIPVFQEVTTGGETVYIATGDKFEQFKSERPGVAVQQYWDYLTSKISIGIGIPKMLVIPYSMQGTVVRADLETAAAFFKARSAVIAHVMREIYQWVIGWAKDFDRSLAGSPKADWSSVTIRPPRNINVDVGRNSQAIISELEAGIRTLADVCGELGHDWREVLRQRAKEAAYVNRLVQEFGADNVTREQIALVGPPPAALPEKSPAQAAVVVRNNGNNGHNGHARINLYEHASKG